MVSDDAARGGSLFMFCNTEESTEVSMEDNTEVSTEDNTEMPGMYNRIIK